MVLSRDIAALGIYPAVDPLDLHQPPVSTRTSSARSTTTPRAVQGTLQRYKELRDIIAILGMDELSPRTSWPWPAHARSSASCRSPFTWPKVFTGTPGKYVPLGNHPRLQDDRQRQCDHLPEQAFYMVGTIDEAFERRKIQ